MYRVDFSILLRLRNDADRTEGTSRLEAVIVEALIVCCHERRTSVHAGEIAALANGILSRQDEFLKLEAREVGAKLKKLWLRTTRLDSAGRGIYLLKEVCARIHDLGRAFGVPALREGLPGCPHCKQS
jgi:hypothetical protein